MGLDISVSLGALALCLLVLSTVFMIGGYFLMAWSAVTRPNDKTWGIWAIFLLPVGIIFALQPRNKIKLGVKSVRRGFLAIAISLALYGIFNQISPTPLAWLK